MCTHTHTHTHTHTGIWSCDQKCYCNHQSCFPAWCSPGRRLTPRMTSAEHGAPASCRGARSCLQPAAVSDTLSSQQPPCGVRASHPGRTSETIPRRESHTVRAQGEGRYQTTRGGAAVPTPSHTPTRVQSSPVPTWGHLIHLSSRTVPGKLLLMIMVLELPHITLRPTHSPWRFAAVLENTYLN